jgi:hypothetical protein
LVRVGFFIFIFIFIFILCAALVILFLIIMGAKIPREIRLEVIRKWLEGKSRDRIAREVHIGVVL